MDPVMIEKLQAMKRYRSSKRSFLHSFTKCTMVMFFSGLFLSSPLWLPKLFAVVTHVQKVILSPKSLFVLCNIIVMVLVRGSRTQEGKQVPDIYEEYTRSNIKRNTEVVKAICVADTKMIEEEDEEEVVEVEEEENGGYNCGGEEEEEEEEEENGGYNFGGEEEEENGGYSCGEEEEEEISFPMVELNRRVEDFIAKVNQQRRMEAKMLL